MIGKLFSKTILLGGAGGAVYISNSIDISDNLPPRHLNLQNASFTKTIGSLKDIELYEKFHHCSFVFIDSWPNETTYNFEKFLNIYNNDQWRQRVIQGANRFKDRCKTKKVVTLAFNRTRFDLKV